MASTKPELAPAQIDPAEWDLRVQLAACYRAFVHYGWTDLIYTHLSARVPGHPDQYLINPYGLTFNEIKASNLLKVDFDGNILAGDYPYIKAGHAIHSAILKVRPEVNALLHSHTRAGMAVSCMECGLLPLTQQSNELRDILCYHDYGIASRHEEECRRLGEDMGDKWVMIMRNHGLLAAGRNIAEAFYHHYELESACKVQVDVLGAGQDYVIPDADVIDEQAREGLPPADAPARHSILAWEAVLRLLDAKDPSFRE
jgi:ribulose-5-phosphate 4-epimerase/fuculose-1-phosphate aldolase